MHYVLVAERSLENILPTTIASLCKYGNPKSIGIIVPDSDIEIFSRLASAIVKVIPESLVIHNWSVKKISKKLKYSYRAGWYFQQFLKLSYGSFSGLSDYIIWDADTIALKNIKFTIQGVSCINLSREYHQEYFKTYEKLTGQKATLKKSAISQYLHIKTEFIDELISLICKNTNCNDWIEGVLNSIAGTNPSEFSEYETYVNFLVDKHPNMIIFSKERWFRYGSYVIQEYFWLGVPGDLLVKLENLFSGYAYVSFERHQKTLVKAVFARILILLRNSS